MTVPVQRDGGSQVARSPVPRHRLEKGIGDTLHVMLEEDQVPAEARSSLSRDRGDPDGRVVCLVK